METKIKILTITEPVTNVPNSIGFSERYSKISVPREYYSQIEVEENEYVPDEQTEDI